MAFLLNCVHSPSSQHLWSSPVSGPVLSPHSLLLNKTFPTSEFKDWFLEVWVLSQVLQVFERKSRRDSPLFLEPVLLTCPPPLPCRSSASNREFSVQQPQPSSQHDQAGAKSVATINSSSVERHLSWNYIAMEEEDKEDLIQFKYQNVRLEFLAFFLKQVLKERWRR